MLGTLFRFIGKDTTYKNESGKPLIVIRILIISVVLYCLATLILCNAALDMKGFLLYSAVLVVFIAIFAASYFLRTIRILPIFYAGIIIWIILLLHQFGWNIGVQHFLMVLLVLTFFAFYGRYRIKACIAAVLCCLRIWMFLTYHNWDPLWSLDPARETILQTLNSITIFWCISVVAFLFSKDSQYLESKLVEYNVLLAQQANTDTLTGLYNRRKAMNFLEELIKKGASGAGFSLCICDIDLFKEVNDQYGHDAGDEVLQRLGALFLHEITGNDFVARWGGEEFVIVFPDCNGDQANIKLNNIASRIRSLRFSREGREFGITMTFGLAEYDFRHGLDATLKDADEKLYLGKKNGRNRIVF